MGLRVNPPVDALKTHVNRATRVPTFALNQQINNRQLAAAKPGQQFFIPNHS
jgi:hypothetical protein